MGLKDTPFYKYIERVSKLTHTQIMSKAYSENVLAQMADLNLEQLDRGVYSDNQDTPDYSPYTIEIKKAQGKIWQHMTFDDTGETRRSIRYVYRGGKLQVLINDRFNLLRNYSENIIGLTQTSIADVQDEIRENIQEQIRP